VMKGQMAMVFVLCKLAVILPLVRSGRSFSLQNIIEQIKVPLNHIRQFRQAPKYLSVYDYLVRHD
jgi:hypothetical protein